MFSPANNSILFHIKDLVAVSARTQFPAKPNAQDCFVGVKRLRLATVLLLLLLCSVAGRA
jgi:hypothetical protein